MLKEGVCLGAFWDTGDAFPWRSLVPSMEVGSCLWRMSPTNLCQLLSFLQSLPSSTDNIAYFYLRIPPLLSDNIATRTRKHALADLRVCIINMADPRPDDGARTAQVETEPTPSQLEPESMRQRIKNRGRAKIDRAKAKIDRTKAKIDRAKAKMDSLLHKEPAQRPEPEFPEVNIAIMAMEQVIPEPS